MKNRSYAFGASLIALAALGAAAQAHAAGTSATAAASPADTPAPGAPVAEAAPNAGIADIIVTAQRRSESLQRSSVVVNVVSAEAIARNGVTQVTDLTKILPGVQIGVAGPAPQVYIRGVGDTSVTANANPSVSINIDGVYVGRGQSIGSEFYDIERVEVLKGPQGTLYGRNASGGALNLLTRRPKLSVYSGDFSVELGSFSSATVTAAANIPLGPTLAARVSGTYVNKDGYTSVGFGDDKHRSGRVKLLWQPSSDVSLLLNGSVGHVGGQQTSAVLVTKVPGLTTQNPWTDVADPSVQSFIISQAGALAFATDPLYAGEAFQNMNFWNASAQLDANLGFATLTVLPAYRHASMSYTSLNSVPYKDGGAFGNVPAHPETAKQTSVEVRLAHESPNFKWVLGGYFYNEDQYGQFESRVGLISSNGETFTLGTRSYAAFGQATYSISHAFRLIGGIRYTSDKRTINGALALVAPVFGCGFPFPPLAPGTVCPLETYGGQKVFKNVSWKGGFEADVGPKSLLFATVASGFKAGGFNRTVSNVPGAGPNEAQLYQPEKLIAYEVGLKNRFLDNRLQINLEGFYWNYKNHQEATILIDGKGIPALTVVNAGKARMFGGSVDLVATPWANGTFNASAEYDNSKYTQFLIQDLFNIPGSTGCKVNFAAVPIPTRDCSGFELTRAPKWSGSAGYTQVFPLGAAGSIEATGDMQYASSRWLSADFIPNARAPSYTTFNASLTYISANHLLTLTGFVRNITNVAVYQGGLEAPFEPGVIVATIAPPRNYGVRMALHF